MNIIYETERLIIKKWQKKDYNDLFEYASDDRVSKYLFPTYKTKQTAKDRIDKLIGDYDDELSNKDYAVVLKNENKVIGSISLGSYSPKAGGTIMIGYALNANYWGNGYITEAVKGAFKYIKENKIAKRIYAIHDVENYKSGNVMKRAGMTFEGTMRKAGENVYHSRYDVALYSILEEEID